MATTRFLLAACAALAFQLQAADKLIPQISLPAMEPTPAIDGAIGDTEWRGAAGMLGFKNRENALMFPAEARFLIGRDKANLYLAMSSELPPAGLSSTAKKNYDTNALWLDDTVELLFCPDPAAAVPKLYHIRLNNDGVYDSGATVGKADLPWRPQFELKGVADKKLWNLELRLPLAQFGLEPGKMPATSGLRLFRNWRNVMRLEERNKRYPLQTSWNWKDSAYLTATDMPLIHWDDTAPAVQLKRLLAPGARPQFELELSVFNPGPAPVKAKLDFKNDPTTSQSQLSADEYTIAPGATEKVVKAVPTISPEERAETTLHISGDDGKKVYYHRYFYWGLAKPQNLFEGTEPGKLAFNAAYFPSFDTLTVQADLAAVKVADYPKIMNVVLYAPDGQRLAEASMPAVSKQRVSRLNWKIPDLKPLAKLHAAKPAFKVELLADGKAVASETFMRYLPEWEGNQLGKADILVPPYTAIEVDGRTLKTILREHTLDDMGLPRQIKAKGRDILTGDGVVVEASVGGKTFKLAGAGLKGLEHSPTAAKTTADWKAGPLSGEAVGEWSFDGMLLYHLTLDPTTEKVDSLRLLVPVSKRTATLMHATYDSSRGRAIGALPPGDGRVWDCTKLPARVGMTGTFIPYLWIGGEERGIALFGENDRGCVLDDIGPTHELVRRGDTVYIVFNMINKPASWEQPRTITFGLMATPLKPMPENWRRHDMWSSQVKNMWGKPDIFAPGDLVHPMTFLGTVGFMGGLTGACQLDPPDCDTTVWEKMVEARKTRKIDQKFLNAWIKKYTYKPTGEQYFDSSMNGNNYGQFLWYGFGTMQKMDGEVLVFTNPRGARFDTPVGQTFLDEWYNKPFNRRDYAFGGGLQYQTDTVESYRDYCAWWYNKMFEVGIGHSVVFDDFFPCPNFKDVGGYAYLRPDGKMQPSVGILNMRQLALRVAVLMDQRGMQCRNMTHVTSTSMAPVLSFTYMSYTWEDAFGILDYQDRSTREEIRAGSLGRQFGNLPTVMASLTSGHSKEQFDHCDRTAVGVLLTHELRWVRDFPNCWVKTSDNKPYNEELFWPEFKKLIDFGYGKPGVEVFNYWDEGYPLRVPGHETSSLVASKPGAALLVVCDWDKGGDYQAELDLAKLGLKPGFTAVNLADRSPVQVDGDRLSFKLPKHDYIIIALEGAK